MIQEFEQKISDSEKRSADLSMEAQAQSTATASIMPPEELEPIEESE